MSSSIFEVKESESDSEKVLDFEIEDSGILSTQVESEVTKDHTYTKEPDVLQGEVMLDTDPAAPTEEMGGISSTEKPKSTRSSRSSTKAVEKPKAKKAAASKKATANKKSKPTKDDITLEVNEISESAGNGLMDDTEEAVAASEEEPKPVAKRGRKRKNEEKENTKEDNASENAKETKSKTPKKKVKGAVSTPPSSKKGRVTADAEDTVVDTENLPPGWIRKSVTRKSGKTAGQIDVYIFSPDGQKFRSKPDVACYLARTKSSFKLDDFDFSKKRTPIKANVTEKKQPSAKKTPKKKAVAEKPKSPEKKKEKPAPAKKAKLLVKIVSSKSKKKANKESPAKEKSPVKGKASKGNKKKTNA